MVVDSLTQETFITDFIRPPCLDRKLRNLSEVLLTTASVSL